MAMDGSAPIEVEGYGELIEDGEQADAQQHGTRPHDRESVARMGTSSRESGLQLDGGRRLLLRGRWLDQCQGRGRRSCAKAGRRGRGGAHLGMRIGRCRRLPWMLPCLTTTSSTAVFFGTCLLLLLKAMVLCLLCLFA